jgi:hypothetical protein
VEHLERLTAYKVRPAPDQPPGKWETGTQNHEGIAGALGALEYLGWLGETYGGEYGERYGGEMRGRRLHLKQAMHAVRAYELELSRAAIEALAEVQGLRVWGITDERMIDRRVPTVSFTLEGHPRARWRKLETEDLRLGRQLLRVGRDGAPGAGGERRNGAGRHGALQRHRRDPKAGGGDRRDRRSTKEQVKEVSGRRCNADPITGTMREPFKAQDRHL